MREGELNESRKHRLKHREMALHATILTGGTRYWDRAKQNTKKSEDVWWEDSQTTGMKRARKQMPFDVVCKSSPTQDREQET